MYAKSNDTALVVRPASQTVEWTLDEPSSDTAAIDGIDHVSNPHARCPVALLLDTSGSMQGRPLAELQDAVGQFLREIAADELALLSVELSLFTFGGSVENPLTFGSAAESRLPQLTAAGQTPLGGAVTAAVAAIRERQAVYAKNAVPAYRPWVVIMSDGEPNDAHWERAADVLRQHAQSDRWNVFCVAMGEEANVARLQRFSVLPVQRLAGLRFAALFRWLSASLKQVSRSSTSAGKQTLPSTAEWTFSA